MSGAGSHGLAALRERYGLIAARLGERDAAAVRDVLKADIIALFREVERELAELSALKNDVRVLVDRWKVLDAASAGIARRTPTGTPAARPATPAATPPVPEAPPRSPAPPTVPTPLFNPSVHTPAAASSPVGMRATPSEPRPTLQADHLGASTYIEKGWSQLALGNPVAAEASLTRALELAPGDSHAEALMGWAQMLQEKYDDALWVFQKVLLREPNNALARVNVGYICLKKGIFGEAIEHLSRVIRLDGDRKATLYAHFYLGLVYLEREMYEDAEGFFQRTLALGPNLIEAYYEQGRAQWFGGNPAGAQETWRAGFAANKFSPWGKRCAEVLEIVAGGGAPPRGF